MNIGVFSFALVVLVVIGLALLGGIVAVVMLLANPKTRIAGVVLLAIGLLVIVLAVLSIGGLLLLGSSGAEPYIYTVF